RVQVTSPSVPGLSVEGRVDMVPAVVDPGRHTVPIRVRLANPDGRLRPNTFARVRFESIAPVRPPAIPATAPTTARAEHYAYVQSEAGRFARREIVPGPARDGRVPVLSGLATGETIVVDGGLLLDNQIDLGT